MIQRLLFTFTLLFSLCYGEEVQTNVVCATVPKSGTHLLEKALKNLVGPNLHTLIQPNSTETFRKALYEINGEVYIIHLFSDLSLVKSCDPAHFKKILLIRDPRDVIVSFYHHLKMGLSWPFKPEFMGGAKIKEIFSSPESTPLEGIRAAALWIKDPDVYVIRFEDLVGAKGGGSDLAQFETLFNLAAYIGHPKTAEEIDALRAQLFGGTWTFRNGQIGEWKTFFSKEEIDLLKAEIGQELIDLGYESDLDW